MEDLISIGTIGLIKAINTFKPDKNIKLATYASRCIENEILMYLRRNNKTKLEVSIDEPLNVDWDGNELLLSDILGTDENVIKLAQECDVDVANFNCPGQTVVSGTEEGVAKAVAGAKAAGCKIAKKLNVAGAYHSRLMHSAMVKLAEELKNISFGTPSMPVYCNYEARVVEGPDDIRSMLEHQVCGSVRWTASMQKLVDQGHRLFIELGPGKTLAGMMARICKEATVISIEDVPSLEAAVAELNK